MYNKRLAGYGNIERLADFNESNIDKALGTVSNGGASPRTVNAYREVAHALGEWALKIERILDRNPVSATKRRNEHVDIPRTRRALTIERAQRLLNASGTRQMFYRVALSTGQHVSEIRSLQWGDVKLDGDRPGIPVAGRNHEGETCR